MLHETALKLLLPLELGAVLDQSLSVDGRALDTVQSRADDLLREMYPDSANELLPEWERVYALIPSAADTLQHRRAKLVQRIIATVDIKAPYFVALAATLGFTITITMLTPFQAGGNHCGEPIWRADIYWVWQINVAGTPVYNFRAGDSAAGERLSWWPPETALEKIFAELKPPEVYFQYIYI